MCVYTAVRPTYTVPHSGRVLIPLCETPTQVGCVVAYRTFLSPESGGTHPQVCDFLSRPVVDGSRAEPPQRVVCTNPLSWDAMGDDMAGEGAAAEREPHLGCMPIIHPHSNVHYFLHGRTQLNGTISDIDEHCHMEARCGADGSLLLDMGFVQRYWARGFVVPFPAWSMFSFPGLNMHAYDWNYFFNNIRKNGADRVNAWLQARTIHMSN